MCLLCFVLCTVETAGFLLEGQTFFPARQLSLLCSAVTLCLAAVLAFLWICYVDYRLFQDHARLEKYYPFAAIPALLICAAAVCNLLFDVFFWVTEDNVYYRTPCSSCPVQWYTATSPTVRYSPTTTGSSRAGICLCRC